MGAGVNWLAAVDDNEDGESDAGMAKVVNKDDRKLSTDQEFKHKFKDKKDLVESILYLDSIGIDPVSERAVFTG